MSQVKKRRLNSQKFFGSFFQKRTASLLAFRRFLGALADGASLICPKFAVCP
jgi:hypothetical protein